MDNMQSQLTKLIIVPTYIVTPVTISDRVRVMTAGDKDGTFELLSFIKDK